MKKNLLLSFLLVLLVSGCSQDELVKERFESSVGRIFTASFDQKDTRTYIENGNLLRWTKDDQISLFDGNTLNRQYEFDGETGDNGGTFTIVSKPYGTGNGLEANYAVYPYASTIKITESGVITATLPTEQSYVENSFGLGDNTMVAVTKDTEDTFLKFKNVGGYLKLQLYGDGITVKSITLTGNTNEKLAGQATITPVYGEDPTISMANDATKSITLDCGTGVEIGTSSETATVFWLVLPPTTFENGFTITVTDINDNEFSKSTSKNISIQRNVYLAMNPIEVETVETIPNNQIWYISSDGNIINPNNTTGFGANIISNVYENGKGIITFDNDVTTIKGFSNSNTLTSITIPNNVTTIESYAFQNCNSLKTVIFPKSLNIIRESAFAYCNFLEDFTIPSSVTYIGSYAFEGCTSLTSITIPNSVTFIDSNPFSRCNSLANITVEQGNSNYDSRNNCNAIIETAVNALVSGCKNTIIPNDVVYIIGAFEGCKSLTSITIPNSVTLITGYAFKGCTSLKNITIPNSVTEIGLSAFENCTSFTNITIPESVTDIGDMAFCHCTSLAILNVKATIPPRLDYSAFVECSSDLKVYVPTESLNVYKKADNWKYLNLTTE